MMSNLNENDNSNLLDMELLTQEDDNLLSYFLSTDISTDEVSIPASNPYSSSSGFDPLKAPTSFPPDLQHVPQIGLHSNLTNNPTAFPSSDHLKHDNMFQFQAETNPVNKTTNNNPAFMMMKNPSQSMQKTKEKLGSSTIPTTTTSSGGSMAAAATESSFLSGSANQNTVEPAPTGNPDEDKRQRRLARNRESARQSRRRKKQYLELLEEKVSQLSEEIDTTRRRHIESADEKLSFLKSEFLASLDNKIHSNPPASVEELRNGIKLILERFGPSSEERTILMDYHFAQLNNALLPPYTRFLLWISIQNDDFFYGSSALHKKFENKNDSKSGIVCGKDGLWGVLSNELNITFEQDEKIKNQYRSQATKANKTERRRAAMAMTYLDRLHQSMSQRGKIVQKHSSTIFEDILTPEQAVKYMKWTESNKDFLSSSKLDKTVTTNGDDNTLLKGNDKIGQILKKSDRDLSVEDVTVLLAALSQQAN